MSEDQIYGVKGVHWYDSLLDNTESVFLRPPISVNGDRYVLLEGTSAGLSRKII